MLVDQVYIFIWSILTGAVLGVLFDLFRGFRWEGIRDIWVYIQDIIFWIISAIVIIVSAFLINEGELRGYMLIGYLLGAGFYMLLFSCYILAIFKYINKEIRKFFNFLGKALSKMKNRIFKVFDNKSENQKNYNKNVKKLKLKKEN